MNHKIKLHAFIHLTQGIKINYSLIILLVILGICSCKKNADIQQVDVYIAGQVQEGNNYFAKYWKNGSLVNLPTAQNSYSIANSITVSGSDIYVAGYEQTPGNSIVAKYWKNGVGVNLGNGLANTYAFDIAVSGTDMYVAGEERYQLINGSHGFAKYWKNGVAVNLNDSSVDALGTAIVVSGNDIYVAGVEYGAYW